MQHHTGETSSELRVIKNGLRTHLKNEEEFKHVSKYKLRRAIFAEFNKLWQLQIHLQLIQNESKIAKLLN